MVQRGQKTYKLAATVDVDGNVPKTFTIFEEVPIVLLPGDPDQFAFQPVDRRHVCVCGRAHLLIPICAIRQSCVWHSQQHALEDRLRHEPPPGIERERIKVHHTRDQAYRLLLLLGMVDDILQKVAGHAATEVVGVHVHNAQRDVCRPGMVEAGAGQPAGAGTDRHHAAARIERLVDVEE